VSVTSVPERGESARPIPRRDPAPLLLAAALGGALAVRIGLAGVDGARSAPAGAVFGVIVLSAAIAGGWRPAIGIRDLSVAAIGSAAVLGFPLVRHVLAPGSALGTPTTRWLGVVIFVAVAEEALLRGALWDALERGYGTSAALASTTVVFAVLHIPLYGVRVLPVDLAVGVVLGGARIWSGRATAPVIVHVVADVAGWWIR